MSQPSTDEVLDELVNEGFPLTEQRRELVSLIMSKERRFTAEELLAELRQRQSAISRATVFRTLDLLVSLGHVGRVRGEGRPGYAVCDVGHHHHLVCSSCDRVLHLSGCPISAYLGEVERRTGFVIDHHNLDIAGASGFPRVLQRRTSATLF